MHAFLNWMSLGFGCISILAYILTKVIARTAFKHLKCAVSTTANRTLTPDHFLKLTNVFLSLGLRWF